MALVLLGLGSARERYTHMAKCLDALAALGPITLSPVYESAAVGGSGWYLNMVVALESQQSLAELSAQFKQIERQLGRTGIEPHSIDIDVLSYDDLVGCHAGIELPRRDLLEFAFVLLPLAQMLPDLCHPVTGQSYAQLWQGFDAVEQQLRPVVFNWGDRELALGVTP